jgi:hypothetical protein
MNILTQDPTHKDEYSVAHLRPKNLIFVWMNSWVAQFRIHLDLNISTKTYSSSYIHILRSRILVNHKSIKQQQTGQYLATLKSFTIKASTT